MRRLLVFSALTTVVAAVFPAASAARRATCGARLLGATMDRTQAGAGQRWARVSLYNGSARTCRTGGYIGMRLVGRRGHVVPTRVVRVDRAHVRTVVLRPGERAVTTVRWGAIPGRGEPTAGRCEPNPFLVEITPPDSVRQLVAGWHGGPVCEHGRIEVRPLRHG